MKGFFDAHTDRVRILVTGSSRMDVYRRGGDNLICATRRSARSTCDGKPAGTPHDSVSFPPAAMYNPFRT